MHRSALLIAALMGSAALAGCSSSGGSGIAATPAATTPPAVVTPTRTAPVVARGGPTRSVGYALNANAAPDRSTPGLNGTVLTENANRARFQTTIGARQVDVDLPLVSSQIIPATSPANPLNVQVESRIYTRQTGTFGDSNYREEGLGVVDARYAQLSQYTVEEGFGDTTTNIYAVAPVDQSTVRAVPTAGTASYSGFAGADSVQGGVAGRNSTNSLSGTIALQADFGAGTVNGAIADDDSDLVATLGGRITGNDYAGDIISITSGGQTAIDTSGANDRAAFTGGFYGPAAEETAGLIDISGTDVQTQRRTEVVGGFIATKQ